MAELDDYQSQMAASIIAHHGKDRGAIERIRDSFIGDMEKPNAHIVLNQLAVKLDAYLDTIPARGPEREPRDLAQVIAP